MCDQVSYAPPHGGERPSGNDNAVSQSEVKDQPSLITKTCAPPGGHCYRAKRTERGPFGHGKAWSAPS